MLAALLLIFSHFVVSALDTADLLLSVTHSFALFLQSAPLPTESLTPISEIPERYKNVSISNPDSVFSYYLWGSVSIVTILASVITYLFKLAIDGYKQRISALKESLTKEQTEKQKNKDDFISAIKEMNSNFLSELKLRDEKEDLTMREIAIQHNKQADQFTTALKEINHSFTQRLEKKEEDNRVFQQKMLETFGNVSMALQNLSGNLQRLEKNTQ